MSCAVCTKNTLLSPLPSPFIFYLYIFEKNTFFWQKKQIQRTGNNTSHFPLLSSSHQEGTSSRVFELCSSLVVRCMKLGRAFRQITKGWGGVGSRGGGEKQTLATMMTKSWKVAIFLKDKKGGSIGMSCQECVLSSVRLCCCVGHLMCHTLKKGQKNYLCF